MNVPLMIVTPNKFVQKYKFEPENKQTILFDLKQKKQPIKFDPAQPLVFYKNPDDIGKSIESKEDDILTSVNIAFGKFKQRRRNIFEGDKAITKVKQSQYLHSIVPQNLKYIDSFLIFNTKINPYKHEGKVDNLNKYN